MDSESGEDEIVYESMPCIRIYKSGRVERFFGSEFVPADAASSVDAVIDPVSGVSARLYRPPPHRHWSPRGRGREGRSASRSSSTTTAAASASAPRSTPSSTPTSTPSSRARASSSSPSSTASPPSTPSPAPTPTRGAPSSGSLRTPLPPQPQP
uniref:Uncharacterized protein n=1 Tax=Ananas comosus var. bracteatus TaxID=296719 RepID=A0A6V7P2W3_ANACO|nr:unnamed protein product [Ananas comosus var. bracteatus]